MLNGDSHEECVSDRSGTAFEDLNSYRGVVSFEPKTREWLAAAEPISQSFAHLFALLSVPSIEALENGRPAIALPSINEIELLVFALRTVIRNHERMERGPVFFF